MSTPAKVWTRFKKISAGKEIHFRIQEMQSDKYEKVLELFLDHFATEEPVHKATKVTDNQESFNEYKQCFYSLIKESVYQIDVCCLDNDSEDLQIVGASIMILEKKDEPASDADVAKMLNSDEMKTFLKVTKVMADSFQVLTKFNLDLYYDDRGIVVHPDYRGLGLAGELFKARMVICKERGVPMTGAWMTSVGSQKAAEKLGWETVCEFNFKDLEKIRGVKFEEASVLCKLMVIKV